MRFSIFPLEWVEPSKLSNNNMKLLIPVFDWNKKALIIIQVLNYEDRAEALLGNEEKVFSGIPSIEKKISERVRQFLSFQLFDRF